MTEDLIKPYGDTLGDGVMQLSFTLPVENSPKAQKAAKSYLTILNFEDIIVAHSQKIAQGFTFFVAYARAKPVIDYSSINEPAEEFKTMGFYEINQRINNDLKRRIVVVGATIGSDAHTVGIDAILNMKGYNHDYGLERYPEIDAYNMGAQVSSETLIQKALEVNADAILVSQTVTQKDTHIHNLTGLVELLEAENIRKRFIIIVGGPRINNDFAKELGYDAGFGSGTLPSAVASYIFKKVLKKTVKEKGK
jgi:beta-lysine 5,6-aminomutase beta subunit